MPLAARHDGDGPRDVGALVVEPVGEVTRTRTMVGISMLDGSGAEVTAVTEFLASLLAAEASGSTVRSYAMALLRWWRFLVAVGVDWKVASRVEARDFVLWMRCPTTKRGSGGRGT